MPIDASLPFCFDHLGLVVRSLEKGRRSIERGLGVREWTAPVTDEVNGVHIQFGRDMAGMVYELLVPIDDQSPVFSALETGRAILNHVAYRVPDLALGAAQLRSGGFSPIGTPNPAIAYGGARIQFFVSSSRFVVELIEAVDFAHPFEILTVPDRGIFDEN